MILLKKPGLGRALHWAGGQTLLALVVCMFTQCVCQNSREDAAPTSAAVEAAPVLQAEPAPVELPNTLDVKDLDADERAVLVEVLTGQFDPCGEPKSFLESLQAAQPCERAVEAAVFVVDLVAKGLSKRQIVRLLLTELARTTERADFSFEGSPYVGDPSSKVVIVEYMDFECPFCRVANGPAKELAKKHGAVLYVKHLPIDHHEFAHAAAIASLAADRQGLFWKMSALLFENQETLSLERIDALAQEAGCDMKRFEADKKSPELELIIKRDIAEADRLMIDGTPTFYVDGYMIDYDAMEAKILKAKTATAH